LHVAAGIVERWASANEAQNKKVAVTKVANALVLKKFITGIPVKNSVSDFP
jgi:hypothetical protein